MIEYTIVTEETIDDLVAKIGYTYYRNYFMREMKQANLNNCELVAYRKDGVWKEVRIDRVYNIDFVMTQKEDKL